MDPRQEAMQYIVHVLEPQSVDGFFAWNFFDGILMQKEYFSGYVWDDTAAEILEERPELQEQLEQKKAADPDFAKNHRAQLDFIYKNSEWYEKSHNRFPVARLMREVEVEKE